MLSHINRTTEKVSLGGKLGSKLVALAIFSLFSSHTSAQSHQDQHISPKGYTNQALSHDSIDYRFYDAMTQPQTTYIARSCSIEGGDNISLPTWLHNQDSPRNGYQTYSIDRQLLTGRENNTPFIINDSCGNDITLTTGEIRKGLGEMRVFGKSIPDSLLGENKENKHITTVFSPSGEVLVPIGHTLSSVSLVIYPDLMTTPTGHPIEIMLYIHPSDSNFVSERMSKASKGGYGKPAHTFALAISNPNITATMTITHDTYTTISDHNSGVIKLGLQISTDTIAVLSRDPDNGMIGIVNNTPMPPTVYITADNNDYRATTSISIPGGNNGIERISMNARIPMPEPANPANNNITTDNITLSYLIPSTIGGEPIKANEKYLFHFGNATTVPPIIISHTGDEVIPADPLNECVIWLSPKEVPTPSPSLR